MSPPMPSQPLYAQIKVAIARRIQEDVWPSDFQVPREEELAEEFEASPLTVRRALRELMRTADSLRQLTDYLEENPQSLLRGKPKEEQ